jgi:hypothetical protein
LYSDFQRLGRHRPACDGRELRSDLRLRGWQLGGRDLVEVYRKLGVREVWFCERGSLQFFRLLADGGEERYEEAATSELVPQLPRDLFLACMAEFDQTAALRALRARLVSH